jgi:hypothetical protein
MHGNRHCGSQAADNKYITGAHQATDKVATTKQPTHVVCGKAQATVPAGGGPEAKLAVPAIWKLSTYKT